MSPTVSRENGFRLRCAFRIHVFESGAKLLERILTERRQHWQGRGKYKEPATPSTANLPPLPNSWTWVSWEMVLAREEGAFKRGPFGSALTKAIFVEIEPPYMLSVVEPDVSTMTIARKKVDTGFRLWTECLRTRQFPGYPRRVVSFTAFVRLSKN